MAGRVLLAELRGALVALDRWVKDGTPAPASRYPRIADGALVPSVKLNPAIPGLAMAKGPNEKPRLDFGPDIGKGIISKALPVALKDRYRVLVPSVDADGNETAADVASVYELAFFNWDPGRRAGDESADLDPVRGLDMAARDHRLDDSVPRPGTCDPSTSGTDA
jgi:hypothetical protein